MQGVTGDLLVDRHAGDAQVKTGSQYRESYLTPVSYEQLSEHSL